MGADNQILLCGVEIEYQSGLLAEILEMSELGADRRAIDATSNVTTWGEMLYSCIKRLMPFTITMAFNPNMDWKTAIGAAAETITITWPIPGGYTTAATLSFKGAMTSFRIRGTLEDRVVATVTITPSGAPTITPGTPVV